MTAMIRWLKLQNAREIVHGPVRMVFYSDYHSVPAENELPVSQDQNMRIKVFLCFKLCECALEQAVKNIR
jgi:hypothetical protein